MSLQVLRLPGIGHRYVCELGHGARLGPTRGRALDPQQSRDECRGPGHWLERAS